MDPIDVTKLQCSPARWDIYFNGGPLIFEIPHVNAFRRKFTGEWGLPLLTDIATIQTLYNVEKRIKDLLEESLRETLFRGLLHFHRRLVMLNGKWVSMLNAKWRASGDFDNGMKMRTLRVNVGECLRFRGGWHINCHFDSCVVSKDLLPYLPLFQEEDCVICLDEEPNILFPLCRHVPYCSSCSNDIQDPTCPMCRIVGPRVILS